MIGALRGHVAGAGRGPTIGASIVSPAVVLGKTTDKSTQTIISLPVQIAVWSARPLGALMILVAVQLSMVGLYLPPVFKFVPSYTPQTIISLPVHTALWLDRALGALVVLIAVQLSVPGLYRAPVFRW